MSDYYIGIMSGTSLDGIDTVVTEISADGRLRVLSHIEYPLHPTLRKTYLDLQQSSNDELHTEALAANELAKAYAQSVTMALKKAGIEVSNIVALGAHGQTIRHQPDQGYTLQSLNPALLAELTGIDVIADFRSRDIAAGGQGAPLVPAFHAKQFGRNDDVAVLNIGGISNLSIIHSNRQISTSGFDCGPGNMLMDQWIQKHRQLPFDENGQWAAIGKPIPELLESFLSDPYFTKIPPKSSGRDLFNDTWLEHHIHQARQENASPEDVQATLLQLTAQSIARDLKAYAPEVKRLIICGGGSKNTHLVNAISHLCPQSITDSKDYGLDSQTVEAAAFAWLAWCHKTKQPANLPAVTGAIGPRILGALYPA